jgi:hypothetical protein
MPSRSIAGTTRTEGLASKFTAARGFTMRQSKHEGCNKKQEVNTMLDTIDRQCAWAFGQLIERHALSGDWAGMRLLEIYWVRFSQNFHERDRTELCQTEDDARHTMRQYTQQQRRGAPSPPPEWWQQRLLPRTTRSS